jgi:hypothetical protein
MRDQPLGEAVGALTMRRIREGVVIAREGAPDRGDLPRGSFFIDRLDLAFGSSICLASDEGIAPISISR